MKKGFTLVELVIVIAIVIVLSVVSVPIYRNYVDKAKMAEGYALLGTIFSAQKAYYSEHGNFLWCKNSSSGDDLFTCNDEVLGIDARGNKYFTSFKVSQGGTEGIGGIKTNITVFTVMPNELVKGDNMYLRLDFSMTTSKIKFYQVSQV